MSWFCVAPQVERLEVVNKKWVRIKLMPGASVDASVSHFFLVFCILFTAHGAMFHL